MICALQEIGFNENVVPKAYLNGIYVFNEPLEPGSDALAALGMHDAVLDFEITPNRADALGMRGVAGKWARLMMKSRTLKKSC